MPIGRSEHPDTDIKGYSVQEEHARERYYENKMRSLSDEDIERMKQATKEAYLEAMLEIDQYKKQRKSKKDPDLISSTTARNLVGRARFEELVERGLLNRVGSGRAKNSAKYVSKKQLLNLNNTYIQ